jgi:hypothetical protein
MARKAIRHGMDGKGRKLALIDNADGTFCVLVQCANYAGHIRGGIAHTWRYVGESSRLTQPTGEALFAQRNKQAA